MPAEDRRYRLFINQLTTAGDPGPMLTIWATIIKELLELRRDRAGLMVLLVMPMALVLIVSLVQDNVMQATGQAPIRVLFVDADQSSLSKAIGNQIKSAGGLDLVSQVKGQPVSAEAAKKSVVKGDFQFAIVIPAGTGAAFKEMIGKRAQDAIVIKGKPAPQPTPAKAAGKSAVTVYFDPAVQGAFRTAVMNALQRVILGIEFKEQAAVLAENFPKQMKQAMSGMMNPFMAAPLAPEVSFKMDTAPVLKLDEEVAFNSRLLKRPTAAQQNVPAWALFGMFFIVVPLSGSLIRERQTGTLRRLLTMPVSPLALLTGKLCAYVLVCLIQFALMLAAGCYLLPLLGTSGLVLGHELWSVAPIALSAALAATGYGIMVGTLARSYEQASMFGAVSVVIAAALGGIMIPVYVMPRYMQDISSFSPLAWGLNAFQDVFVRGGDLGTVSREISLLLLFFVVTITVSWLALSRNRTGE
jgi:ABC-2 type transport system permease protein